VGGEEAGGEGGVRGGWSGVGVREESERIGCSRP